MDKLIVGCGYLGRRVAQLWLAQGHRVFGTTRSQKRADELSRQGIEPVICDVLDRDSLRNIPLSPTVLYCVGFNRSAGPSMRELYVDGLRNFFSSTSWDRGPGKFIYISSTGVYGQCQGEEVDEAAPTEPLEESGRVVLEAEQVVRSLCHHEDGQFLILRFAGIYGPGRVIRRHAIETGEPLIGAPDQWLNLIHVEDGAAVVIAADAKPAAHSVFNVSDDRPVKRRDFYTRMARLLGAPAPRFVPPEPGQPLPPHERANRRIVNRRMREELGVPLRYPSYEEGLPASLDG